MSNEKMAAMDQVSAACVYGTQPNEVMEIHGRYHLVCYDVDGNLKWEDWIDNVVATVGRNDMLDKYLSGTSWSTGTVYMGLKNSGAVNAADTMSSKAWSELNIIASRPSVSFSSASGGSKGTSTAVVFDITAAGPTTVNGVFVVVGGTSAVNNTTGVLYSVGDFSSSKSVVSGDKINVTYSTSLT